MITKEITDKDMLLIHKIAKRAGELFSLSFEQKLDVELDLTNVNCDIDLQRLLDAYDFNFAHDVNGINRHLDHETGDLKDCFLPRFATVGSISKAAP